jgi:hypothetical protein
VASVGPAGGRYLVTMAALRGRKRIPLRLLRFLDDAHRLGILRQTGPVYQFRHAKLQDRLAGGQHHSQPAASTPERLAGRASPNLRKRNMGANQ